MQKAEAAKRRSIWITTVVIGVLCGVSGLEHGFFETLQGATIATGRNISAIGEANRFWKCGFEHAYTLIPILQITGVTAMLISVAVIICATCFMRQRYAWLVFILLSVFQYITGGGAAQIGLAVVMGLVAARIDKPLKIWRAVVPTILRRIVGKAWLPLLVIFSALFCQSIVTAVFGFFHGISDPGVILKVLWDMLYIMMGLFVLSIVSAFSHDRGIGTKKL
jgi:hypothetical protein